jgi:membrane protease YdiL (CAAX protease family)
MKTEPFWSHIALLPLAGLMLAIALVWRLVDVFVLRLGGTWLNIMPSKLFPFLIILGLFFRYRRAEVSTVLGLNRRQLRPQVILGVVIGCSIYILIEIVPGLIYGTLLDKSYSLDLTILYVDILWYQFIFFLTNALLEETLFRGLIQNGLRPRFTPGKAILISALVFGMWHLCWPIVNGLSGGFSSSQAASMFIFSAILGVFFGTYYERFSSRVTLAGPIMIHTLVNFLNEDVKLGPALSVQGPDFAFQNSTLTALTAVFLLVTLAVFIKLAWSTKIEQVNSWWARLKSVGRPAQP